MKALFLLITTVVVCSARHSRKLLQTGHVAYKVVDISADSRSYMVTDGVYVLKAKTSDILNDVTECRYYKNVKKSEQIVQLKDITIQNIGIKRIQQMFTKCHGHMTKQRSRRDSDNFNHKLTEHKPFSGDFGTGKPSGAGTHFAIMPGTKWCGFQNVANSIDDLGVKNKTDACCRTHDHCPYYIDRFETKYHYYNAYPWTLSHCACDEHLFNCLKKVNTRKANEVGHMFYGFLDVQCFTFESGTYCGNENSILSKLWCSKKRVGQMAVMQKFPYKWSHGATNETRSKMIG